MNDDKWLDGLKFARRLNYSDAQYEEALKRIESQPDLNKLLDALVDVKSNSINRQIDTNNISDTQETAAQIEDKKSSASSSLSSCYSSITSFPSTSSSDVSLQETFAQQQQSVLRKIYIDGPNVAKTHGNGDFSWRGIRLCVSWFLARQHPVKVIVPKDRCLHVDDSTLQALSGILETTPSGCNDDWFVIKAARINNGIIVSNDQYRDEKRFNVDLQRFIQLNRLPYAFIGDLFIPAEDPRGSLGPTLHEFLQESIAERWNHSNQQQQHHQNKLYKTKSHQRYQRTGYPSRTQPQNSINNCHQRHQPNSLRSTLSLPIEQITNTSHCQQQFLVSNQVSTAGLDQSSYYQSTQDNHGRQHNQLRRTISAAYSNTKDIDSQCQVQVPIRNNRALCRTKSHNI